MRTVDKILLKVSKSCRIWFVMFCYDVREVFLVLFWLRNQFWLAEQGTIARRTCSSSHLRTQHLIMCFYSQDRNHKKTLPMCDSLTSALFKLRCKANVGSLETLHWYIETQQWSGRKQTSDLVLLWPGKWLNMILFHYCYYIAGQYHYMLKFFKISTGDDTILTF